MSADQAFYYIHVTLYLCYLALWHPYSVAGQTEVLWVDPLNRGWKPHTPYRFYLKHRPISGVISVQMYEAGTLLFDTGDIIGK